MRLIPRHFKLLIIILAFGHSIAAQTYRNLVLKGGGIRGIAYCGALKVLDEKNVSADIRRVGGTSVGAIVGALYSTGFTAAEIEAIIFELDIKTFNDGQWFVLGGQKRMRKKLDGTKATGCNNG
jgi:NTE family protein